MKTVNSEAQDDVALSGGAVINQEQILPWLPYSAPPTVNSLRHVGVHSPHRHSTRNIALCTRIMHCMFSYHQATASSLPTAAVAVRGLNWQPSTASTSATQATWSSVPHHAAQTRSDGQGHYDHPITTVLKRPQAGYDLAGARPCSPVPERLLRYDVDMGLYIQYATVAMSQKLIV